MHRVCASKIAICIRAYDILFASFHSFKENTLITFYVPDIVLSQQCVSCTQQSYGLEQRTQAPMSTQSGSGAHQIQEKLHILLSLTIACSFLVRHYTEISYYESNSSKNTMVKRC